MLFSALQYLGPGENLMRVILSIFLCLLAFSAVAELATAQIQSETIPDELILDGRVEAVQQSTVSAQVSGRIILSNRPV
jgi:multidrug efflux pump subunit AcrA (membrane-fusion protein)